MNNNLLNKILGCSDYKLVEKESVKSETFNLIM